MTAKTRGDSHEKGERAVGLHSVAEMSTAVEGWYRRHARALPWRVGPDALDRGERPDPYRVWLSEIMLQQTTVPHAAPYFLRFVERWPRIEELAAAGWDDVSAAWAGLGYYSRARNLHACAAAVTAAGGFPQDAAALQALPGIGPYTAAAIAAIAFGERIAPVDGNIERVMSRVFAIGSDRTEAGWRASKRVIAAAARNVFQQSAPSVRAGDLAQGLMDLGASVCTPRTPRCDLCPLGSVCAARAAGRAEAYPQKPEKSERPVRRGAAYVALTGTDVLLIRRPPEGLLGGMLMPPGSDWREGDAPAMGEGAPRSAPGLAQWTHVGDVRHVFTHFALRLDVYVGRVPVARARDWSGEGHEWVALDRALRQLPTVGRKAVALATRGLVSQEHVTQSD